MAVVMNIVSVTDAAASLRIHVRDGLSQERRQLPALESGYFNIDELRFEQLLCLLQDYAGLVSAQGAGLDNQEQHLFFSQNELMVMANILALDLTALERDFRRQLHEQIELKLSHQTVGANLIALVRKLDEWLRLLYQPQSNAGEQIYKMLESLLSGLRSDIRTLLHRLPPAPEQSPIVSLQFSQWLVAGAEEQLSNTLSVDDELDMDALQVSLLKAIDLLQRECKRYLPESMQCQFHDPAVALRAVFVELYQKLQAKLNRFTLNFFDFYFTEVLQVKSRPLIPDSVYLIVHPSQQEQTLNIPKGAEFVAGLDAQSRDIVYSADSDTEINDAQVVQIHSLYFPRSALINNVAINNNTKSEGDIKLLADGCWLDTITAVPDADFKVRNQLTHKPLFGCERDTHAASSAVSARLGFALANKILLLREGTRKVTLNLVFQDIPNVSWSRLKRILRDLPGNSRGKSNEKAKFFSYFGDMFSLSVTTNKGWYDIDEYKPAYNALDVDIKPNCLRISFYLAADAPAISAYDASVHGDNLDTDVAVLRVLLKDNYVQYPYDLLKHLVLREIRLEVEVEGYQDLLLHNNIGQLSALAPFAPFGPLADVGSYFIVGAEELCNKQLTRMNLDIEWSGLPTAPGGFTRWYQGYHNIKNSSQFMVSTSVLVDGRWQPKTSATQKLQPLFSSHMVQGTERLRDQQQLSAHSIINYVKPQEAITHSGIFSYTPQTKNGLFKFTLQAPLGGFGQREYAQLLAATLTYNARVKHEQFARPLPNPPYTPEIASIRLNYTAVSVVNLNEPDKLSNPKIRDQFIHLHPLGWETISPLRHPKIHLLPQYNSPGNFIIGIKASDAEQVNLFFHLHNNSLPMSTKYEEGAVSIDVNQEKSTALVEELTTSGLDWSYLVENQWRPLPATHIQSDSTQSFKISGIVNLRLPKAITTANTRLSPGLLWIKISAQHQLKNFSHIYTVYAQALKATWSAGNHPVATQAMVLKPDSIKRSRESIPGIAAVTQVCSSFGGVPAETAAHLRSRVSERLRHKQRALTPMDYEMLILQQFPQVYKVKCFANLRSKVGNVLSAGHLLIIPVPYLHRVTAADYKPHFDGFLIEQIGEFVRALAPAFAHISVENPVYEEVQVRCAVHFKKGYQRGASLNRLNQELCEFISPWHSRGNRVHFGWNISEQEIKSFLHNLDYIDHATDFSVLRIAPSAENLFALDDTADQAGTSARSGSFIPTYLWSTAVPLAHHYLQTLDDRTQILAEVTGYDELEIGSNFIIS